jgi:hypothetical protein
MCGNLAVWLRVVQRHETGVRLPDALIAATAVQLA